MKKKKKNQAYIVLSNYVKLYMLFLLNILTLNVITLLYQVEKEKKQSSQITENSSH